jgi:hypothetical protein
MVSTKISLQAWNNEQPISYVWICGVACPTGQDFRHNTETEDAEEYCDFSELDLLSKLWDLEGEIDENSTWCWDGIGNVRDDRGNTIYNVKARRD